MPAVAELPSLVWWLKNMSLVYVSFPTVLTLSLVGTIAATLLTPPTDRESLVAFYRHVRPFGFWNPIRRQAELSEAEKADPPRARSSPF